MRKPTKIYLKSLKTKQMLKNQSAQRNKMDKLKNKDYFLLVNLLVKIFLCSTIIFLFTFGIYVKVKVFTVLAFCQRILKLGYKISIFSKSTFPGLLKIVLTFNPKQSEPRTALVKTFCKVFFSHALILKLIIIATTQSSLI